MSGDLCRHGVNVDNCPDCDIAPPVAKPKRTRKKKAAPEPCKKAAVLCPLCQCEMEIRNGRYGEFYGCPDYPACRGTRDILNPVVKVAPATFTPLLDWVDRERNQLIPYRGQMPRPTELDLYFIGVAEKHGHDLFDPDDGEEP